MIFLLQRGVPNTQIGLRRHPIENLTRKEQIQIKYISQYDRQQKKNAKKVGPQMARQN
jgi:hypothetical protein